MSFVLKDYQVVQILRYWKRDCFISFVFKDYQVVQILRYWKSEVCDKQLLSVRFVAWKLHLR